MESETVSFDSAPEALPRSCLAGAAESICAGFDRYEKGKIAGRYYVPIDKSPRGTLIPIAASKGLNRSRVLSFARIFQNLEVYSGNETSGGPRNFANQASLDF